ncbi:LytR family transcriptional regulator, partial [Kitasatospora sp. NPDC018614]
MNEWPEGWSDENRGPRYGRGSAGAQPEGARVMRQVRRGGPAVPPGQRGGPGRGPTAPPHGVPQQPSYVDGGEGGGYADGGPGYDSGYNTGQVYGASGGGGPAGPGGSRPRGPRPAPNWRRRIKWTAITVVTVVVVTSVATYFWADSKLHRDVDLSKVIDRPEGGEGTNYLIVGSDSRDGLSSEDTKKLHTGSAAG